MGDKMKTMSMNARGLLQIAAAMSLVGAASLSTAYAAPAADDADAKARESWREYMHQLQAPWKGCFHANYPSHQWEEVQCQAAPGYRSKLPSRTENNEQIVGNGKDVVAQAPSGTHFSLVKGSFPTVTGVKTEKSAGVRAFGGGGILGANEYTLQVNTNFAHTAACGTFTKCQAWVQYVLATNTPVSLTSNQLTGNSEVFIEYWLIDYGSSSTAKCPSGFINGGKDQAGPGVDCVQNTAATLVANGQIPITSLANLTLSGSAAAGGSDAATVTFDGQAFTATVADSMTDISSGWNIAEYNVVGNAGGSRADFNTGSSVTVKVNVTDGSTTAPTCLPPSSIKGTTGETNNLTAGACTTGGGSSPFIQFTESN
jgi:hypothetical protein